METAAHPQAVRCRYEMLVREIRAELIAETQLPEEYLS
jgi:hypothetical protein